jgi:hypothetical protein
MSSKKWSPRRSFGMRRIGARRLSAALMLLFSMSWPHPLLCSLELSGSAFVKDSKAYKQLVVQSLEVRAQAGLLTDFKKALRHNPVKHLQDAERFGAIAAMDRHPTGATAT